MKMKAYPLVSMDYLTRQALRVVKWIRSRSGLQQQVLSLERMPNEVLDLIYDKLEPDDLVSCFWISKSLRKSAIEHVNTKWIEQQMPRYLNVWQSFPKEDQNGLQMLKILSGRKAMDSLKVKYYTFMDNATHADFKGDWMVWSKDDAITTLHICNPRSLDSVQSIDTFTIPRASREEQSVREYAAIVQLHATMDKGALVVMEDYNWNSVSGEKIDSLFFLLRVQFPAAAPQVTWSLPLYDCFPSIAVGVKSFYMAPKFNECHNSTIPSTVVMSSLEDGCTVRTILLSGAQYARTTSRLLALPPSEDYLVFIHESQPQTQLRVFIQQIPEGDQTSCSPAQEVDVAVISRHIAASLDSEVHLFYTTQPVWPSLQTLDFLVSIPHMCDLIRQATGRDQLPRSGALLIPQEGLLIQSVKARNTFLGSVFAAEFLHYLASDRNHVVDPNAQCHHHYLAALGIRRMVHECFAHRFSLTPGNPYIRPVGTSLMTFIPCILADTNGLIRPSFRGLDANRWTIAKWDGDILFLSDEKRAIIFKFGV